MEKDLFTDLPREIKLEILSRLPIRSVMNCKLVDRSWCSLIGSLEFAKSYKPDCIAVKRYGVVDEGVDGMSQKNSCKKAFKFSFPHPAPLHSSVNGLLFVSLCEQKPRDMYICNPVTREYITIPPPENANLHRDTYGFGVSRNSGQFKLVTVSEPLCKVYTLGTGRWRSFALDPSSRPLKHREYGSGLFLNGNIHWLANDGLDDSQWISCFDLETELFTTLRAPHHFVGILDCCTLHVVSDCLGIFDCSSKHEVVIWLMKDYGDEKSWAKQFIIPEMTYYLSQFIFAFKNGKNGDPVLRSWLGDTAYYYSNKTKALEEIILGLSLVSYTPSFLRLKTFSSTETVSSF